MGQTSHSKAELVVKKCFIKNLKYKMNPNSNSSLGGPKFEDFTKINLI